MSTPPPPPRVPVRALAALGAGLAVALILPAPVGLVLAAVIWAGRVALRRIVRRRGAAREAAENARAIGGGGVALGAERSGRAVLLSAPQLAAHGLILGATGAGKSTTLLRILADQIARGLPVVAIDLKGSPAFAERLRAAASESGRPLRIWTPDGPASWNPLASGNATELKDKLIATESFSEPHYRRAAERYVQLALRTMAELEPGGAPTLAGVVSMLDPGRLGAAARGLAGPLGEHVRGYLAALAPDQLSAVRGLESRLAVITESHTGRFLGGGPEAIDLRRALAGEEIVLFSLNSSRYGQLAAQLGTLAVQDLVSGAGRRLEAQAGPPLRAVVGIDEFSALGSDNVIALLARGRESGVSVLLATQELADLDRAARGLRDQVLGNTAVKIAHRQDVPASAETVARMAGTVRVWERSYHDQPPGHGRAGAFGTRSSTLRLVDRFAIEPDRVRTLETGEAVVIVKTPRSSARVARIHPPPARSRDGPELG